MAPYVRILETILERSRDRSAAYPPVSARQILAALDALTENALYRLTASRRPSRSSLRHQKIVRRAEDYLSDPGREGSVTAAELSGVLGYPVRTLYAAFEAQLGIGPNQLQNPIRLYRLRTMLRTKAHGPSTVSQVILEAGFTHLGRTAGIYRQHFGETPSEALRLSA